jgi:hypothetical protein
MKVAEHQIYGLPWDRSASQNPDDEEDLPVPRTKSEDSGPLKIEHSSPSYHLDQQLSPSQPSRIPVAMDRSCATPITKRSSLVLRGVSGHDAATLTTRHTSPKQNVVPAASDALRTQDEAGKVLDTNTAPALYHITDASSDDEDDDLPAARCDIIDATYRWKAFAKAREPDEEHLTQPYLFQIRQDYKLYVLSRQSYYSDIC